MSIIDNYENNHSMSLKNTSAQRITEIIEKQKAFFATGESRKIEFRKQMLLKLGDALKKWEKPLCDALWQDLHKSYEEAFMTEIGLLYGEISNSIKQLKKWAARRRRPSPLSILPSSSYIIREPLGCALIVSPWNYPVQLLLNPLVGAIAAGCTAILKPSPYVENVSLALQQMIEETFEDKYIAIVQGDRSVNGELFARRYDIVFFTGSPALAKVLAKAQAQYLTPMVLELGGKSPCIVDKKADIKIAAKRIVWGKCLNSGQTCIAPDYLFLHEDIKKDFIQAFKEELSVLYPEGTKDSRYFVRIVRDVAFDRITSYLKDGKVIAGGRYDSSLRWIEPTLLDEVSPDSAVMQNEIFGPVFPIMTFRDIKEVENFINSREKPLALYFFGDKSDGWKLLSATSSGGACINDTIMHVANNKIPFGGVGNSGMGNYHGERSFLAFSHERSIVASPSCIDPDFRYMPYRRFKLIKKLLKAL